MMAYAPGQRILCGCQTKSGTTPLGATSPGHTGLRAGVNAQGREFLEFSTLLNESAGGVLLAIRKPLRRWSRVSLEIPSAPLLMNVSLPGTVRRLRARVVRITSVEGWNLCGLQFLRPLA